jgi:hypothetical protein
MAATNERKQKAREIAGKIAAMSDDERAALAARLPTVVNPDGRALSFRNTAMLMMQSGREDLTIVAGFKQWIRAGRVVNKGEHAIGFILVPMTRKKNDESLDDDDNEKKGMHFKHVAVFDVSQTSELEQPAESKTEVVAS